VTRADLSTVHRLADGALSPLEGPMDGETWHRVLDEQRILVAGRPFAWTIPLSLPATDAEAAKLSRGGSAALQNEEGATIGILDGLEVFNWDKRYAAVYRTERSITRRPADSAIPAGWGGRLRACCRRP
jgi:sulfate adenylyltransferase